MSSKVSWLFQSKPYYTEGSVEMKLQHNPIEFYLLEGQPEVEEHKLNGLGHKLVFRKRPNDPRLVRYHKMQFTYTKMDKDAFDLLNTYTRFWNQPLYVKIWQFDARKDNTTISGSVQCWPAIHGSTEVYFTPYRNLSDDDEDVSSTKVWWQGSQMRGNEYTIDYTEGKITFLPGYLPSITDEIRMHFVWKPKIRILSLDPRPAAGQVHTEPRYAPVVILREV